MHPRDPLASLPRERVERFAAALAEVEREIDWPLLGRVWCEGEDPRLFAPEQRSAMLDASLRFAAELAPALAELPPGPRRSLYVGASVAELAPILLEHAVLRREVLWLNLPGEEARELDRALGAASARLGESLPRLCTEPLARLDRIPCDHGWLVGVLTDPDRYPALHDRLYGRRGEGATGRGDLAREERAAAELVEELLERLLPPCLLTASDEELSLCLPAARARGWRVEVPERARLSPLVGDAVRTCRVSQGGRP